MSLIIKFAASAGNIFRHVYTHWTNCPSLLCPDQKRDASTPEHEIGGKVQEQLENISQVILAFAAEYKASQLNYA